MQQQQQQQQQHLQHLQHHPVQSPPSPFPFIEGISLHQHDDPSDMETDVEEGLEFGFKQRKLDQNHLEPEPELESESESEAFNSLLSLPLEILHHIIELVYYDNNPSSISSNLETFSKTMPLLLKTINSLSLRFLYKYANFNRPHAFDKFLQNLIASPDIGFYVEFMDFQQFTSIGLGRTGRMMQEIQMVTLDTIHTALNLTPNLLEFLALENIQDDMDVGVLDCLFNGLPKLQALDFCGASSEKFNKAFQELIIYDPIANVLKNRGGSAATLQSNKTIEKSPLHDLFKVSFHDCSNLQLETYEKIIPHLVNLRRLDLNHTSITSTFLTQHMPQTARLTHLSLARCSKLTTKDLIQFLTQHPSVSNGLLQWLSLQTDSNVVSPLSDTYLLFTLRNLNAPGLRYLNLGGLPIDKRHLQVIKTKFTSLESLGILHSANVDINDINEYLHQNEHLKCIDITGCKKISRFHIPQLLSKNFNENLLAIEFDYKILMDLSGGDYVRATPQSQSYLDPVVAPQIWKFYDNEGRRSWIYKIESTDPFYKSIVNSSSGGFNRTASILNLTYYDLETGKKITQKFRKPDFLKYASRKICCSIGYHRLSDAKKKSYLEGKLEEDVWPTEFSQRGIYNYYSLNVK